MPSITDRLSTALADRYRIERELGQGGMATVYLAEDLKHKRKVALKVLKPELAAVLGAERFVQEITTTASLRHPHILPLYDSGEAAGFLYYVMPLVEGGTLRDRLTREKQLPIDEALTIAREVADALGYAHAHGVVHRDIKPENILLEGGHAVVTDFGIARAVSEAGDERLTQTGVSIGTPAYMSPEQAAGEPEIDGRSDLYSLGCVLYEMLGGQPPFTGPTADVITRQHMVTVAAPVTNLRPTVPPDVAGALARTLAKSPADRFNPAAQFVQALTISSQPVASRATPASRRPGARMALYAVGLLALLVGVWFGGRSLLTGRSKVQIERIAVLPLDNQTGDSGQQFFADGMTRELIGVLTDAGVRVLGHRAVVAYRNTALSTGEIAAKLGVDAIVTGSVLQAGDVVQVAAELTDPRTGENMWARTFSRPASDVLTLQREVAGEIARGIRARLTPDQQKALAPAGSVNPKAYAQYLLGTEQLNLRTADGYRQSVAYLNRAIALDSMFAPAWAGLALTHAVAIFFHMTDPDSARSAIEQAAARALSLDGRLGDPLIARGMARLLVEWDFADAEIELRRGMERNPSIAGQALYSWFPWETGQFAEGVAVSSRLIDQEPTTAQWYSDVGWNHMSAGDSAASRRYALRAIEVDSAFYEPYHLLVWLEIGVRDFPAARARLVEAAKVAGGDFWLRQTMGGLILAGTGDTAGARGVLRSLDRDPRMAQRAMLLHAIGEVDSMYVLFGKAIEAHDADAIWILQSVPALRPLRREPRYQRLLERMGLPEHLRR